MPIHCYPPWAEPASILSTSHMDHALKDAIQSERQLTVGNSTRAYTSPARNTDALMPFAPISWSGLTTKHTSPSAPQQSYYFQEV